MRFRRSGVTLLEVMIVVGIIGLLVAVIVPNYLKARAKTQQTICIRNLETLACAKEQWALDNRKARNRTPTWADLVATNGYLKTQPVCPAGGVYTLRNLATKPTCNKGAALGHTL